MTMIAESASTSHANCPKEHSMPPTLSAEALNQRGKEFFPQFLGIVINDVGDRTLRAELPLEKWHLAPNGYLHAGAVVTLADTACGYACIANLPEGATSFTTIELKSNFMS